ncbi:hypothetical protein AX15_002110 [Amanita polypyramis BW_CC]|nr:hypothetical protein AX15_002110 [Amanita polypyramis BW_CC]
MLGTTVPRISILSSRQVLPVDETRIEYLAKSVIHNPYNFVGGDANSRSIPATNYSSDNGKIILPSFRTISQIAAGGRDDPTGDVWRHNMRKELVRTPPLVVPSAEIPSPVPSRQSPLQTQLPSSSTSHQSTMHPQSALCRTNCTPPVRTRSPPSSINHPSEGHSGSQARMPGARISDPAGLANYDDAFSEAETSSSLDSDDASFSADSTPTDSGWECFVARSYDDQNHTVYECQWSNGNSGVCGYTAKRQLVKRHVEDRHLRIRRFECSFCGQRFAQKSSCNIHQNSHTGAKPYPCFKCGKWFSDPSKRTRHTCSIKAVSH